MLGTHSAKRALARFNIESANHPHDSVELSEVRFGQVRDCLVIHLVAVIGDQSSIRCQQAQRGVRVRHASNLVALAGSVGHWFPTTTSGLCRGTPTTHSRLTPGQGIVKACFVS